MSIKPTRYGTRRRLAQEQKDARRAVPTDRPKPEGIIVANGAVTSTVPVRVTVTIWIGGK